MQQFPSYSKAPDTTLDYVIDWTNWLDPQSTDTIVASTWTVSLMPNYTGSSNPANTGAQGLAVTQSSFTTTTATVWLSGGVLNKLYRVKNQITTVAGRVQDQTFELYIQWR